MIFDVCLFLFFSPKEIHFLSHFVHPDNKKKMTATACTCACPPSGTDISKSYQQDPLPTAWECVHGCSCWLIPHLDKNVHVCTLRDAVHRCIEETFWTPEADMEICRSREAAYKSLQAEVTRVRDTNGLSSTAVAALLSEMHITCRFRWSSMLHRSSMLNEAFRAGCTWFVTWLLNCGVCPNLGNLSCCSTSLMLHTFAEVRTNFCYWADHSDGFLRRTLFLAGGLAQQFHWNSSKGYCTILASPEKEAQWKAWHHRPERMTWLATVQRASSLCHHCRSRWSKKGSYCTSLASHPPSSLYPPLAHTSQHT
jgi:hypothetical protein